MAKKQQTQAKAHGRALEPQKKRGGKHDLSQELGGGDSEKPGKKPPADPTPGEPTQGGYKPGDPIQPGF